MQYKQSVLIYLRFFQQVAWKHCSGLKKLSEMADYIKTPCWTMYANKQPNINDHLVKRYIGICPSRNSKFCIKCHIITVGSHRCIKMPEKYVQQIVIFDIL